MDHSMEEEAPLTLLDLPDGCLLRIVSFLNPTDVCKLQTCNKRWQYICKDNQLWKKFLNDVYDLRLEIVDNDLHKDGLWQRVFTDIRRGGPPDHNTLIRFRALSTDGGVDAQRTSYWLDHMFAHNTHTAYCSEIGSNIHCMAVLLDDDAPDVDAAAAADRQFVMDRCFAPLKWMLEQGYNQNHEPDEQGNHPYEQPTDAMVKECMEQWGTQELQHFLLSMVNHFLMGRELGHLLFHGVPPSDLLRVQRRVSSIIQSVRGHEYLHSTGVFVDPSNVRNVVDPSVLARFGTAHGASCPVGIMRSIHVSRAGEFSCPLHTAVVFTANITPEHALRLATTPTSHLALLQQLCDTPLVRVFDDMKDKDSLEAAVQESGLLPAILHASTPNCAAYLVEFDPNVGGVGGGGSGSGPYKQQQQQQQQFKQQQKQKQHDDAQGGLPVLRPVVWFSFFTREQRAACRRAQRAGLVDARSRGGSDHGGGGGDHGDASTHPGTAGTAGTSGTAANTPSSSNSGQYYDAEGVDHDVDHDVDHASSYDNNHHDDEHDGGGVSDHDHDDDHDDNDNDDSDDDDSEEEGDDGRGMGNRLFIDMFNHMRMQSTKGRHTFAAPLHAPHAGNLLLVKLIACENLMEEHQDQHPAPNIDVTYCVSWGQRWNVWRGLRLAPQ